MTTGDGAAEPGGESARPAVRVFGKTVDDQTRCVHYRTAEDVVAIKFRCCQRYYPCHLCHEELEAHPARQWGLAEREQRAILCGVCGTELAIEHYLRVDGCPACHAPFNAGCRLHAHLYFETSGS